MTLPKRTVEEWLTVARVSRPQRIVFAEGKTDASALFIASGLPESTDFRTADEIDHDPATSDFVGGNKARIRDLITGLRLFNERQAEANVISNLKGIVDSDFTYIHGNEHVSTDASLLATEFANLYAGAATFAGVRDSLYAGHGFLMTPVVWDTVVAALRFSFAARYHNARKELHRAAPRAGSYLAKVDQNAEFNWAGYLQAYFGVQGQPCNNLADTIRAYYDDAADFRHFVNSVDLFSVLYEVVRLFRGAGGGLSEANVRSTLLASLATAACDQGGAREIVGWATAA